MMLAAFSSLTIIAHAAEDTKVGPFTVSGFADLYYQYDFNKPGTRNDLTFRQFDIRHNSFSLALLQVNLVKAPTTSDPFGLTINLATGKDVDIANLFEPGGTESTKNLQQAYVTYAGKNGLTVDFGKFFTWIGYESATPANNDLYSLTSLYYVAQPIYHTGFRASSPLGQTGLTGSVYLVNGWNEAEDSNASKSYGATVAGSLGKTAITANYYGGTEGSSSTNGFGSLGQTNIHLADLIITHPLTSKIKLAFNGDYISAKGIGAGDPGGHVYGAAAYLTAQLSTALSGTLRYEGVCDPDDIHGTGGAHLSSVTAGLSYAASPSASFKLELRFDRSNKDSFVSDDGVKDSRTTLTLAHIYRF